MTLNGGRVPGDLSTLVLRLVLGSKNEECQIRWKNRGPERGSPFPGSHSWLGNRRGSVQWLHSWARYLSLPCVLSPYDPSVVGDTLERQKSPWHSLPHAACFRFLWEKLEPSHLSFPHCQQLVCFLCWCLWGFPDNVPGLGGAVQRILALAFPSSWSLVSNLHGLLMGKVTGVASLEHSLAPRTESLKIHFNQQSHF